MQDQQICIVSEVVKGLTITWEEESANREKINKVSKSAFYWDPRHKQ